MSTFPCVIQLTLIELLLDLAAAPAATSAAEIDGTFVTTVAGQVVTITRQDDGADEAAGAITDLTLASQEAGQQG